MKPSRILLILVAILAGGLAAFLATRGDQPVETTVVTQVVQESKAQVLVAMQAIGVGERLTAEKLQWQDWPEGAVRPEYITIAAAPDAPADLTGTVARFEFFPGEPIRQEKLARADQGYLSAVLAEGMRGVSIEVNAASGAGGFIVPNDRVDVILTSSGPLGQQSQPILSNVKVLAIGARLGEVGTTGAPADPENPRAEMFTDGTIATLELTPDQADIVINATALGRLSLTLRSIIDFDESPSAVAQGNANQGIRVIRYGVQTNVQSNAQAEPPPATVDPAAYSPATAVPQMQPEVAPPPVVELQ